MPPKKRKQDDDNTTSDNPDVKKQKKETKKKEDNKKNDNKNDDDKKDKKKKNNQTKKPNKKEIEPLYETDSDDSDYVPYEDEYDDEYVEDEEYVDGVDDYQGNNLDLLILKNIFSGLADNENQKNNPENKIKEKIKKSKMPNELKKKLYKKLKNGITSEKLESWFNDFLSIPFGEFSKPEIDLKKSSSVSIIKYFKDLMTKLDDTVDGLVHVKEEIVNFVAQAIANNKPSPRIIALHGVPGTGKTRIIRDGVAKALNTPMQVFSMGGVKDSSHFLGFDFTYQNSKHGAISQALMDSGVMNPVFVLDELDKISDTSEGEEIQNLLVHLTDPLQNHDFKDKYFDSLPIDLSRVFWIVIFNDIKKLSPILKDRLHIIEIPPPSKVDKINIAKNFLIKEVSLKNNLSEKDFVITPEAIKMIVETFSIKGEGVRTIKRCIETILLKVNTLKLLGKSSKDIKLSFSLEDTSLPIKVDEKNLHKFLDMKEKDNDSMKYMMYM